jgi:hypothetical protein
MFDGIDQAAAVGRVDDDGIDIRPGIDAQDLDLGIDIVVMVRSARLAGPDRLRALRGRRPAG